MKTPDEFRLLYNAGAFDLSGWLTNEMPFPEDTCLLLRESGLPKSFDILGVHFLAEPLGFSEGLWQIGFNWGMDNPLLLEKDSGNILALDGEKTMLVNTSIRAFLLFLEHFGAYVARQPKVAITSFTREQMQEKLARFRNGTLVPKEAPAQRRDPAKEAREMKAYFSSIDPGAFGKKKWWPLIIEQVGDGIL